MRGGSVFKNLLHRKKEAAPDYLGSIADLGNMFLVRLKGSVNIKALENNRDKMTATIERLSLYSKNVIVDFAEVTYTDSATIAALLDRFMTIEKHGHKIGLFNIPEHLMNLIDILRVSHNFTIYTNEDEAIQNHGRGG